MGLEQAILGLSIVMFVATFYAWRWARRLQGSLRGRFGYDLARLLAWIIGLSLVARIVGTGAVFVFDREDLDSALRLSFVAQLFGAGIFLYAAFEVRRISRQRDDDSDSSDTEGSEPLEGVSVEVDEVGVRTAVAIDDLNSNAALSGTH